MAGISLIAHLDADAFFVSVEQALDPTLRGKKVAVGGRERGIISSASYEARACGVYTPMPTSRALQVCPDLILVSHGFGHYSEYSQKLFELCEQLTPQVERRSIDEGFIDLGMCGFKSTAEAEAAVRGLQARIWRELGLGVSFGLAANKLVAGIASKLRKPRGFTVVQAGDEAGFIAALEVGWLPGVGKKTEASLQARGLRLVADLLAQSEREWAAVFGDGWREVRARARGEDDSPVVTEHDEAKSYSQQETFAVDLAELRAVELVARGMVDALLPKLRADGKRARTITVRVRYPDFTHASAAHSLDAASDLETEFYPWLVPLLRKAWMKRSALRLVGVKFSGLEGAAAQMEMFAQVDERKQRLARAVDALRQTRGEGSVVRGWRLGKPREE